MKFSEYLLNTEDEYNGHKQTTVKKLALEEGVALCKELEELCEFNYNFVIELCTDGCYTIWQKDFWEENEHPLHHRDRMILGVTNG